MNGQDEWGTNLDKEMIALKAKVDHLENEIKEMEFLAPKPFISSEQIGQIGKFLLGAIVLVGIFWR